MKLRSGCITAALLGVAALFIVGIVFPVEFVFWILFGWVLFLWQTLPEITVNWVSVGTAAVAFVVLAIGVHWLAGSYCGKSASDAAESPPRCGGSSGLPGWSPL